jgi:hypothetical protein
VLSYSLEFDEGTNQNSWVSLTGLRSDQLELSYKVTQTIQRGGVFHFRLRAKNIWGWGEYSNVVAVQAATRPLAVDDVRSSVLENGDYRADWTHADD